MASGVRLFVGRLVGGDGDVRVGHGRLTGLFGYTPSRVGCMLVAEFAVSENCCVSDGGNKNKCMRVAGVDSSGGGCVGSLVCREVNRRVDCGTTGRIVGSLRGVGVLARERDGVVLCSVRSGILYVPVSRLGSGLETGVLRGVMVNLLRVSRDTWRFGVWGARCAGCKWAGEDREMYVLMSLREDLGGL